MWNPRALPTSPNLWSWDPVGNIMGLNYGVWTSRAGPGRQELTSPHLLHAGDPGLGWEPAGASAAASALPRLPLKTGEGKPSGEPRPSSSSSSSSRHPPPPAPRRAHPGREGGPPLTPPTRARRDQPGRGRHMRRGRGLRRGGPRPGLPRPHGGGLRRRKVCRVAGGGPPPSVRPSVCLPPSQAFSP